MLRLESMTSVFPRSLAFLLTLFCICNTATAAQRPLNPWRKGAFQFSAETTYFTSSANYLERGEYEDLPNGGAFASVDAQFAGRYHFSRSISFFSGATLTRVSAESGSLTRTNSNLTQVFFGTDIVLTRKPLFLVAEIDASLSLDPIDPATDQALTSDGVHSLNAKLIASKKLWGLETFGSLGTRYRDEGLATLLTWTAGVQKPYGKFDFGFGFGGTESLISDELTESERAAVTSRVNAGSLRYYSHNPALLEVRGWVNWMLSRAWTLEFTLAQTLNGANSAAGTSGTVGVTFSLPPPKNSASSAAPKRITDEFEVETQEVDPELFKEDK